MYGCRVFSVCLFDEPHAASSKQRPLCDKGLHVYSSGIDSPLPLLMSYSFTLIQRKCVLMLSFVCFLEAILVSPFEILSSQKPFMATHCGIDHDSLRSRRLEVVRERENGRARARFFLCPPLPSARFFLCPPLPSACYAGYGIDNPFTVNKSSSSVSTNIR